MSPVKMPLVLCLNSGSSSLKFSVFEIDDRGDRRLADGAVEAIGESSSIAWIRSGDRKSERHAACPDPAAALDTAFDMLDDGGFRDFSVIGHRVVHGGAAHTEPELVDRKLVESLQSLTPIAPLHLPAAVAAMEAVRKRFVGVPQVACFDTAFHRTMPEVARRLPIAEELHREGVRRYGFHGLSYEYVMSVLGANPPGRIVIAHLGNGASLAAVKDGVSVDTTMGFTPTGGIFMGTRSGDLDPGVLLFLARERGYSEPMLERLVEHEAGLVALGGTSDVKTLLSRSAVDARADFAVVAFGYAVKKAIGALAAILGGLDVLVFTGGIGERAPRVRAEACRDMEWLGISIDATENERNAPDIGLAASKCRVRVIPTDEDSVIAKHAFRVAARSS